MAYSPGRLKAIFGVTEERQIGSPRVALDLLLKILTLRDSQFPDSECRERQDLEELECQIELLVGARGVFSRDALLDLCANVGPAV